MPMTSFTCRTGPVPDLPRRLHGLLAHTCFYPLLACTVLAGGVLAVRMRLTHSAGYSFLVWNLFLAWIPYGCVVLLLSLRDAGAGRNWLRWGLAGAWLAFLPNCPYIVTDVIHVIGNPHWVWWYDAGLILLFAWTGCFLGVISLREMHVLVRSRLGATTGWAFVMIVCLLCGFGVYLGRFVRLNSWDLLLRPTRVTGEILSRLTDPLSHPRTLGVTLMVAALLLACYLTFAAAGRDGPTERHRGE